MSKKKPTLASRRPTIKGLNDTKARAFIEGGEEGVKGNTLSPTSEGVAPPPTENTYPWEAPEVSGDQMKTYLLRLPEPYMIKLQFIRQQTGRSMQHVCHEALLPHIDAQIKTIVADK